MSRAPDSRALTITPPLSSRELLNSDCSQPLLSSDLLNMRSVRTIPQAPTRSIAPTWSSTPRRLLLPGRGAPAHRCGQQGGPSAGVQPPTRQPRHHGGVLGGWVGAWSTSNDDRRYFVPTPIFRGAAKTAAPLPPERSRTISSST